MDIDLAKYRYRVVRTWALTNDEQYNHIILGESISKPNNKDCRMRQDGSLAFTIEDDDVPTDQYLFHNKEALMRTFRKHHGRIRLHTI